jgi:hypothetical protein
LLLFPALVAAAPAHKSVQDLVRSDSTTLSHLRAASRGHRGQGIEKSKTDHDEARFKSFPHFTSSLTIGGNSTFAGQTFPFTMVGLPPASGKTANLRSVIVPLRMNFVGTPADFDPNPVDHVFEATRAVLNIVNSPLFNDARFVNGVGQFGDQMQRATFWNQMDRHHRWHVKMNAPRIAKPVTIEVGPEVGFITGSNDPNDPIGIVLFDFMNAQIHTILQFADIEPDEVPIFVTDQVFLDFALGFHDAFVRPNDDGSETLQTFIYTSWLSPKAVNRLFADISTINHELGEWLNDPFVNNVVPTWEYPDVDANDGRIDRDAHVCSDNNLLEVGDPQGNGPTFRDFDTIDVPLNGFTYHLQQLALMQWFADESPSSALNGWYTFPDPASLTVPAGYCP